MTVNDILNERPEVNTGTMLQQMEQTRQSQLVNQIKKEQKAAGDAKQWLVNHPYAEQEQKEEMRRRMVGSLRRIEDLASQLHPTAKDNIYSLVNPVL